MAVYATNPIKEMSGYRCPHCRQVSYDYQWVIENEDTFQCPKCSLRSGALKLIQIVLLGRGRIWIK